MLPSTNRWQMYPHKFTDAVQQAGWTQPSVKSPFERKPGMIMSSYGGEKRKDKIRYYLQDTFMGASQSPTRNTAVDDVNDSMMGPSIDDMEVQQSK